MNLEDIAQKAGVSRSTVSRVINNEPYVSPRTRTLVLEIIERENFHPNHAARALVRQRAQVIGVVIPQISNVFFGDNSYFPMLLQGIGEMINQRDHAMLLWLSQPNEDREHFAKRISRNRLQDGLVVASVTGDDPLFERIVEMKTPFVMVERPVRHEDIISYVSIDNVKAAETVVSHLLQLGRRRIATITGHLSITDGVDRLLGYRNSLERAGIPVNDQLIYKGGFGLDFGYIGMKQLLTHKPDAVFAASDTVAVGAMQAITEAGLRVPDDIAIVGFDDIDIASRSNPQLTTVRQPIQQKGAMAASLLVDMVEKTVEGPRQILLPTQLVIRQSCGAIYY